MKKLFFAIAILVSLSAQAQAVDTVKGAIQVQPIVINALTKDTAYQLTWTAFDVKGNDTSVGCNTYVVLHSRKGNQIQALNVPIPKQVVNAWSTDSVLDDYIIKFLGLKKR